MDLLIFEKRRLLRYNLLFQLYRDFFTYGYEVCSNIDYDLYSAQYITKALYLILGLFLLVYLTILQIFINLFYVKYL